MISGLSVVVPAYNEESNIAHTILTLETVLRNHGVEQVEWILVDDGSTDSTWLEITRLANEMPAVIPIKHGENKGLGAALSSGIAQASKEWCTWTPADGQFDPESYVDMMKSSDEADLILLMRDESKRASTRRLLTLIFYGWMRVAFGFNPYGFSGVYLGRRRIVQKIPLYAATGVQNYAVAIYFQRNGYRLQQAHTVIRPRLSGKSKVANIPTMLHVMYEILKLRGLR